MFLLSWNLRNRTGRPKTSLGMDPAPFFDPKTAVLRTMCIFGPPVARFGPGTLAEAFSQTRGHF